MREVRALSRVGRINQIHVAFEQSIKRGAGDEMSAYSIAELIGMRAQSPAFRDHLKAALDSGLITCREVQTKSTGINGGVRFMYKLVETKAPKKRELPVNKAGVKIGQLSLF
jgi:hypothetical protein